MATNASARQKLERAHRIRSTGSRSAPASSAASLLPLPQGPGDTNWFQTLGSATLTAFLVQASPA
jgi:hypothetical protein